MGLKSSQYLCSNIVIILLPYHQNTLTITKLQKLVLFMILL